MSDETEQLFDQWLTERREWLHMSRLAATAPKTTVLRLLNEIDRLRALNPVGEPPIDAIRALVDVSADRCGHVGDGLCPDRLPYPGETVADAHNRRDRECPACVATDAVIAWLDAKETP